MRTKKDAQAVSHSYFLIKCPHCGEELVVEWKELTEHLILFEPQEKEHTFWGGGFTDDCKRTIKTLVSSDSNKDVYHLTCCKCGKEWDEPTKDVYKKRCDIYGRQIEVFELDEVETKRAREFIAKHDHHEEFKAAGKMCFSTLGMQFTYTITPGGLGPLVSIKCNHCGESENITDTDDW